MHTITIFCYSKSNTRWEILGLDLFVQERQQEQKQELITTERPFHFQPQQGITLCWA